MQPIDILLVEDNEGDIILTKEALKDLKMINNIFVVRDGLEAMNYLLKKDSHKNKPTPDLVLLDINLPKLNGQEVLKQLKSHKETSQIPVVMLSTSSSYSDISESFKNEASCYLIKPIDSEKFIREISAIDGLGGNFKKNMNSRS